MVIAIDFDGTITERNEFPHIGKIREHAIEAIKNLQKHGHKCVLWTCRFGVSLAAAREKLQELGLILDGYNESPYELDSRKIVADVYIDDKNVFMVDGVDWYKIEKYILSLNVPQVKIVKGEK